MSRMDVLSDSELADLIANSKMVRKYNKDVDRESAYEMLNEKIVKVEAEAKKEEERLEKEKERKTSSRRTSSRRSTRQNPIIKVLTSATFIRGVFSVLKKIK